MNSTQLPEYQEIGASCPKCGHAGWGSPSTEHHPAGHRCGVPVRCEHLHRKCLRCGYAWAEKPVDAK